MRFRCTYKYSRTEAVEPNQPHIAAMDSQVLLNTPTFPPASTLFAYAALTLVMTCVMRHMNFVQWRKKLPPGPKGLPIVGNLFQLSEDAWFKFTEWKGHYGGLSVSHQQSIRAKGSGQGISSISTSPVRTSSS